MRSGRRWPVAALALLAGGAQAGSYMHSEGDVYYRTSVGVSWADAAWDADGELQDIGCTSRRSSFSHTVEYGASYYYNLLGRLGLSDSRCGDQHRTGPGDLVLGVRGRLDRYRNHRSWELQLTVPLSEQATGHARAGCGVYGLGVSAERTDRPWHALSIGYGARAQFWEKPLAHQASLHLQLGGPLGFAREGRWSWQARASVEAPLVDRPVDPLAAIDDCGTQSEALRAAAQVRYRLASNMSLGCELDGTLAGSDVSRTRGVSCGFSRLWD